LKTLKIKARMERLEVIKMGENHNEEI